MKCIIGLGNPGDQYKNTKHNFGYWVVDRYLKEKDLKLKLGKGDYVFADTENFIVAKTTAFMNNSGHAVKSIVDYFSIELDDLVIVYDDIAENTNPQLPASVIIAITGWKQWWS